MRTCNSTIQYDKMHIQTNDTQLTDSMFVRASDHSIVTIQYAQCEMIRMLLGIQKHAQYISALSQTRLTLGSTAKKAIKTVCVQTSGKNW